MATDKRRRRWRLLFDVVVLLPLQLLSLGALSLATGLVAFVALFALVVMVTSVIFTAALKEASDTYGGGDRYGLRVGYVSDGDRAGRRPAPLSRPLPSRRPRRLRRHGSLRAAVRGVASVVAPPSTR